MECVEQEVGTCCFHSESRMIPTMALHIQHLYMYIHALHMHKAFCEALILLHGFHCGLSMGIKSHCVISVQTVQLGLHCALSVCEWDSIIP